MLQFNSNVHLFQSQDIAVVFDSISLDVIYLQPQIASWFHSFYKPIEKSDFFNSISETQRANVSLLLEQLISLGVITSPENKLSRFDNCLSNFQSKLKPQSLRVLDIIPTFVCNLACQYCYQRNATSPGKYWHNRFLDVEEGKKIVNAFLDIDRISSENLPQKPLELVFIGGEALVHPKLLYQLIPLARNHPNGKENNLKIVVVTNGILIDEKICQLFFKHNVFVIVSIDGSQKSHEQARKDQQGCGRYDEVLRGYKLLKDFGCQVGISVAVGTHNINVFSDEIQKIISSLQPQDISINSCLHDDLNESNPHRVPSEIFAEEMKSIYLKLAQNGRIPAQLMHRFEPFFNQTPRPNFCPAFSEKIVISPNGKAGPCEGFAYLGERMYNWQDFLSNVIFEERKTWSEFSPIFNKDCYQCPLILMCGGGCRYDAYKIHGSINELDTYRCVQEKKLFEWFLIEFLPTICEINFDSKCNFVILTNEMRCNFLKKLKGLETNIAWR